MEMVKELLAKMPELPSLIREAQKPPVKSLAETAYIYNGFDDITLCHLGMEYHLPFQKVTAIHGMPDYREVDQFKSNGQEIAWIHIPIKGESIAIELINEHGFNELGFAVILTPEISDEERRKCDQLADAYKRKRIEEFKVHRDKARAGIVGYKINPDPSVYRWMQVYSPDDAMFAEHSRVTHSSQQIAAAIELLTRVVAGQAAVAAPVNAPTVPAAESLEPERGPDGKIIRQKSGRPKAASEGE